MEQGHQDTAARGTNRVANGNCAAVDVDLARVPVQFLAHGQRLRGERFVGFDQVQLLQRPAGFAQATLGGTDRADAHDGRIHAGIGVGRDFGQHRQAQGLGLGGAHEHDRGCAVIE